MGIMKKCRTKHKGPPFVMLDRETLNSAECKALSNAEFRVYAYIKKKYNGSNNGEISLKYAELGDFMAPGTISTALKGLESKGWIERTKHGGLYRYFNLFRLTGRFDRIR